MSHAHEPSPAEAEVVALLSAARTHDRAPDLLRQRVERERERARRRRTRWRVPGLAAAATLAAAAVIALVAGGGVGHPTVSQAASLALRGANQAPPAPHQGQRLAASVDDVYFPDWRANLGWSAVGQRVDTLQGHHAVTVYYRRGSALVAYTILAGPPLPQPHGAAWSAGWLEVRALTVDGRAVVTWRARGDTCVLSSRDLNAEQLAGLAEATHEEVGA